MNAYENEVRARYGHTEAYREHEQKTKTYTKEKRSEANDGMTALFAAFATLKNSGTDADSADAKALAARLQAHITEHYYTCTNEILAGLGRLYVSDERFQHNIDRHGEGTALFASEAIAAFLNQRSGQ